METQYYRTWEKYKEDHLEIEEKLDDVMSAKMQPYEEMMFGFVMMLLM
jgi:hypothetical protein